MLFASVALTLGVMVPPAESAVDLRWRGTPGCVDEAAVSSSVLDLAGPTSGPVWLGATQGEDGTWAVSVEYADVTRTVESNDCEVLTDAVGLIVAIRTDAVQVAAALQPEPPVPPQPIPVQPADPLPESTVEPLAPPTPPPARTDPELPAEPEVQARVPITATAQIGAGGSLGSLPRGGATLRADAGLRRRAVELGVGALGTLGPPTRRQGVQGSFRVFAGLLQACWVVSSRAVEAPLCARTEVGVMQGRSEGLANPSDRNGLWLAPGARLGVAPARGRFAPEGFLEVVAPLQRHRFVFDGDVTLHRLPAAVVRLGLALRWRGVG